MMRLLRNAYQKWKAQREANKPVTVIGRDGNPLTIPNSLAQEAFEAELIDAADIFDKQLIWHDEWHFVLNFGTLRAVCALAQEHDDPEIALIAVAANIIDWSDHDADEDEDE